MSDFKSVPFLCSRLRKNNPICVDNCRHFYMSGGWKCRVQWNGSSTQGEIEDFVTKFTLL